MATEWYYTSNQQQMGPVSWLEVRELAETGILKPSDLIWTEGMDEWVKAKQKPGLFAEGSNDLPRPPGRRSRRRRNDEDDDDLPESRDRKRQARRRTHERAKMAPGLKVALILGGALLIVLFLGCGVGGLVWLSIRGGAAVGPGNQNYTVKNLHPQGQDVRNFRFQEGQRITITVTNNLANPMTDVDLFVHQGNEGNPPLAFDDRVPQQDRNCRVDFVVPASDNYVVRLINLGPGTANSCFVNLDVR